MKKFIRILLILILCLPYQPTAFAAETTDTLPSGITYTDLESKIDAYVKEHEATTAAVSVAVFTGDQILLNKAYGYTDKENSLVNNEDAVFEWGSCTKLLTWTCVMQLVEEGKLDLNQDIRTYLPKGFFHKLRYDTPITMLNLMNHNAGWQEIATDLFVKNKKDIKTLEDALQYTEPEQINEPGSIVAYSNWGTTLAGYIVERISGQSFTDYVHENIFIPLGMKHTAISSDLSDNQLVSNQRGKEKCYTIDGKSLGTYQFYSSLYPCGMATGTMSDFIVFARAFMPAVGKTSPLFQKPDTLKEMLSSSLDYPDGTARICHGFWTDEMGVPLLWHNGSTLGSSSWFSFNQESDVGMIIFTNQSNESIYNCGLLPLVFGKYKIDQKATIEEDLSGVYMNERSCFKGFTKLYSLFSVMELKRNLDGTYTVPAMNETLTAKDSSSYLMDIGGLKQFPVYTSKNKEGNTILQMIGSDYVMVNGYGIIAKLILLGLFILAAIYSIIVLLIHTISCIRRKKERPMLAYRVAVNLSTLFATLLFTYIAIRLIIVPGAMYRHVQWSLIACAVLGIVPIIYTGLLIIRWSRLNCSNKVKAGLIIQGIVGLIMTFNVYYWIL